VGKRSAKEMGGYLSLGDVESSFMVVVSVKIDGRLAEDDDEWRRKVCN
jgi:hypothetical protein